MNKKNCLILLIFLSILMMSCIQEAPLNPEADILIFSYPQQEMRHVSEIYNDQIVVYPNAGVDINKLAYTITVTSGATNKAIPKATVNDTVFYIQVTSEDKQHSKTYSIIQVGDTFPPVFTFDQWTRYSANFLYENPKDKGFQWFTSNNGAATAFSNKIRPADEYPVRQVSGRGGTGSAVAMVTMQGPGRVLGIKYIPCLAGSTYLGGFNLLNGLSDPLSSTLFGLPFNNGKPEKLTGYYQYTEGKGPYISVKSTHESLIEPDRKDSCNIYAILFESDANVPFLNGNTIASSPNIVARAQISSAEQCPTSGTDFHRFEAAFVYRKPFEWNKLRNNQYKITIVFSSAVRGDYYEGRIGNTLTVDDVEVIYQQATDME
ncbi:MAG: hypothetical protein EZS26_002587 [Candidatus Ordinivivax streblomastigis]|uniref:Putative carbohydrate metabolism domain-containing protein n=1 Tax=Candidatus Ordinivivax streblomastigis TaxID=2540710 RepID=A0A5M8NXJ9_9BACT|nr:MAG: hypothetical protein EZS26_002587 [Candidatus Ordinivivax streblomastigis]